MDLNHLSSFEKKLSYLTVISLIGYLIMIYTKSSIQFFNVNPPKSVAFDKSNLRTLQEQNTIDEVKPIPELTDLIFFKLYQGSWTSSKKISQFKNNRGLIKFTFRTDNSNSIPSSDISLVISIRDGQYIENHIMLETLFPPTPRLSAETNQTLNLGNIFIQQTEFNYFEEGTPEGCKMNLTFNFLNSNENKTFYPLVSGHLESKNCELKINFEAKLFTDDDSKKVSNMSKIFFFLSIIYTINCINEYKKISSNVGIAKKYSSVFICSNIIWDALIGFGMFSIVTKLNVNELYLVLSFLLLFVSAASFRIRTLMFVWKSQNLHLLNNFQLFKRKILRFYIIFYIILMVSLFFSSNIFTNNYLLFIFVSFVWLPQIIKAARVGKCVIEFSSMLVVSLHRLFIPLYIRLCPENVLSFETSITFSVLCIITIIASIITLLLQKFLGGKFFIPKSFLPKTYDFYRSYKELNMSEFQMETITCSICLDPLLIPDGVRASKEINCDKFFEQDNKGSYMVLKIKRLFSKFNISKEKPLMITPCNHIFHSSCLKPWHEQKQDCPMCRLALPILEEN